jgi:hypothetical protein
LVIGTYVKLTKRTLDAQIEPVINLDLPSGANVRITNIGSASIVNLRMTSGAYKRLGSGSAFLIAKAHASPLSIEWQRLGPGDLTIFQMKATVGVLFETRAADAQKAEQTRGLPQQILHGQGFPPTYEVLVEASYQREVDLRRFTQTRRLLVDWLEDGTPYLTDAAMFQLAPLGP